jgi:AraC-like DNA-binding protein
MVLNDTLTASRYLIGVQQMLCEQGVAPSDLLRNTGLKQADLDLPGGFVTVPQLDQFLANAIRLGNDPMPGARLGRRLPISAHGSAGLAGLTAPNAQEAFRTAIRCFPLITQAVTLHLEDRRDGWAVRVEPLPNLPPRCEQFVVQTLLSSISLMAGFLLGFNASTLELELPLQEDHALRHLLPELGGRLRFMAEAYRIKVPRPLLDVPFALADATAHQQALNRCEEELQQLAARRSMSSRLIERLQACEAQPPSLEQLAADLGISSRTLHRKLQAEGVCFRELLNAARMTRAEQMLRHGRPITEIAHLLGYGDSANFTRAFRRHHGMPPSRFTASI